jgi:DNA-binding SARP family transcriptional activator
MGNAKRKVAVIGSLGISPMCRIAIPARKLLAYLAIKNRRVLRSSVANSMWPDNPEAVGRANLRRAIWLLPPGWIICEADEIELDADIDYDAAKKAAQRAIEGQEVSMSDIELLSEDLLPGWHDEWLILAQDSFRLKRVQALETACVTMVKAGHFALAIQAGAAALSAEPLRESAAEALINAHLAQRNRHEAALCFTTFAARLKNELGVQPDATLCDRFADLQALKVNSRRG